MWISVSILPPNPATPFPGSWAGSYRCCFHKTLSRLLEIKTLLFFLPSFNTKWVCWLDQFPTGQISTVFFEIIHGWCWPWSHSFRGSPESSLSSCWGAGWTTGASRPKSFSFVSSWFGWSSLRKTPVPYMRLTVRKISFCCALLVLYHQVEKIYGS